VALCVVDYPLVDITINNLNPVHNDIELTSAVERARDITIRDRDGHMYVI